MHRNKENDVAPQASPDITLQKRKKVKSMVSEIMNRGHGLRSQKISFRFFVHSKLALLGSLRKSMWSSGFSRKYNPK